MMVTCNDIFGIQEIALPYSSLDKAVENITSIGVKKEKLRIFCEKIEDTVKVFFLYLVNDKQANMGIFKDKEYVGEYEHKGIKKKVYLKEVEEQ